MKNVILAVAVCAAASVANAAMKSDTLLLLVGSYAPVEAEGIALYEFDQTTGRANRVCGLSGVLNPSYQTVCRDKGMIYSVGEGNETSSTVNVIAYRTEPPMLSLRATVPAAGASPCHVSVSPDGTQLFTANYGGGSATMIGLDADGMPATEPSVMDFNTAERKSHAHFTAFTPDGGQMWITDLGRDCIHCLDMTDGRADWRAETVSDIVLPDGSGPRHVDFLPRLQRAYVLGELDGCISVIDCSERPARVLQRVVAGARGSADIHVSPDGRFLYASNRLKNDGIAIFSIDQSTGMLSSAGYQPTGIHPRNFIITPNGRFMLVACRDSNAIELYNIDVATGKLTPACRNIDFNKPVCLKWVE